MTVHTKINIFEFLALHLKAYIELYRNNNLAINGKPSWCKRGWKLQDQMPLTDYVQRM